MEPDKKFKLIDIGKALGKVFSIAYNADKKRFVLSIIFNIILAGIAATSAWYFSVFLNTALYNSSGVFLNKKVITVIIIMVSLGIAQTIISLWNHRVLNVFDRKFFTKTFVMAANASETIDIQTYESPGFATLKARVTMYFNKIHSYWDSILDLIQTMVPMIISVVIIATLNKWWLLLFAILPAVINFYVEILDGQSLWECENKASEERKRFSSFYNFFGTKSFIEEIKIYGLKNYFIKGITDARGVIDKIFFERDHVYSKKKLISGIATDILEIAIPIVLIYQVFTGNLLIGTFFFINGRFDSFTNNFRAFLRMISRMYKDTPYVYDILKFIEMQPVIENGTQKIESFEKLEIKNVKFIYPESDRKIINKLNFSVNRGEKVAIIGLNGAGKTTITKLLLRFYLPTNGSVEYNGIKTNDLEKVAFYSKIALLPQDFAKFEVTFEDAIALGDIENGVDIDMVIESAKKAGIHDFIMSHENGYKTQIGRKYKDGVELSGGQWQKVSIAKMFYSKKDLWILDEPTSAIDAEAEAQIFEQLEKLPDDITVIMISHRFSTVRNADRIIVIDKGAVREQGTHEELIALNDEYARLFNLQAEGYK
jgi:ATP-binding cassette subfamily B protein